MRVWPQKQANCKREDRLPIEKRFAKGASGNPGGKPKGSKNRLQGDFLRRLADDFARYGIYAIARMRRSDPSGYVRAVASLMPKEIELTRQFDDLTDEQLSAAVAVARSLAHMAATGQDLGGGTVIQAEPEQAQALQALPEAVRVP